MPYLFCTHVLVNCGAERTNAAARWGAGRTNPGGHRNPSTSAVDRRHQRGRWSHGGNQRNAVREGPTQRGAGTQPWTNATHPWTNAMRCGKDQPGLDQPGWTNGTRRHRRRWSHATGERDRRSVVISSGGEDLATIALRWSSRLGRSLCKDQDVVHCPVSRTCFFITFDELLLFIWRSAMSAAKFCVGRIGCSRVV